MYLQPINITAGSLSDAWFQALYRCVEQGKEFQIDRGSFEKQYRLEFDFVTIHIRHPGIGDLTPKVNPALGIPDPVEEGYLDGYLPYLMTGVEKEKEAYTYGERICKAVLTDPQWIKGKKFDLLIDDMKNFDNGPDFTREISPTTHGWIVNQMELMIRTYKEHGHRNNQMIMQVGQPSDMLLKDPPCLRHIDTRIQDGKLHFFPYFRSWDLFGGFPANLAAIELMKQYCAESIGVENGEIIATSKGLHIYDYVFQIAEAIRGRKMEEFRIEASRMSEFPKRTTDG